MMFSINVKTPTLWLMMTLELHCHMQVFVIDVTWNNGDRFEVYRRYSDFFSFQVC